MSTRIKILKSGFFGRLSTQNHRHSISAPSFASFVVPLLLDSFAYGLPLSVAIEKRLWGPCLSDSATTTMRMLIRKRRYIETRRHDLTRRRIVTTNWSQPHLKLAEVPRALKHVLIDSQNDIRDHVSSCVLLPP